MPKFSIDIPRLISTKKIERPPKDQRQGLVDSPPPTPKSLSPPLPLDVEAALRAVCTQIFNESTNAPLPGIDHDLITSFWRHADATDAPVPYRQPEAQINLTELSRLTRQDVRNPDAVLRVDRVMASTTEPSQAHWRSRSATSGQLTATVPKGVQRRRPVPGGRGGSIDTTCSGAQSDATDDQNASTALTSAVATPLKGSKRTSAHGLPALPDIDPTVFSKAKQWQASDTRVRSPAFTAFHSAAGTSYATPAETLHNIPVPTHSPAQRPYHQAHVSSTETTLATPAESRHTQRERATTVDSSTSPSDARSGRTTFRERASSRARSLSQGLRGYLRPGSRRAPPEENEASNNPWVQNAAIRNAESSRGWIQNATTRIKDLTRPGTSNADRNINMNLSKRARRLSRDSFTFRRRGSTDQIGTNSQRSPADLSGAPERVMHSAAKHTRASQSIEGLLATGAIDLNRELPPLPAIGTWEGDGSEDRSDSKTHSLVSPIVPEKDTIRLRTVTVEMPPALNGPSSPCLVMSATAFPGDFEYYEPLRTPSPISESSIKEFRATTALSKHSVHSVAVSTLEGEDDDDDYEVALESPRVAEVVNRNSAPDLRPQLVHNRRPSGSSKATSRASSRRLSIAEHIGEMPAMPRAVTADELPTLRHDEDSHTSDEYKTAPEHQSIGSALTQRVILHPSKTKSKWWKAGRSSKSWTTNMEHGRMDSGTVLANDFASSPVIRYA